MPKRIQRKRIKGWRMPPNTVYVGRPTKWGNPFSVREGEVNLVLRTYRAYIDKGFRRIAMYHELRGKDLACWCPLDQPCHADILLELANPKPSRIPLENER